MDFSEAVQWWEEWQLRVLILASLFLQYFLYFAAPLRKRRIPSWFRFIIWLAYLGSDAVAIYALATLFNRHKKQEWVSIHRADASLEALWAPILLVHLGGVDAITAYNIEDNELWRRHVLTSVSQITVAIYVFHKSESGDNRLLQAAICIFVAGVLKCIEKPVALRSASISRLMNIKSSSRSGELPGMATYYPFIDRPPRSKRQDWLVQEKPEDWSASHEGLQVALSVSFDRLYTKEQVSGASLLPVLLRAAHDLDKIRVEEFLPYHYVLLVFLVQAISLVCVRPRIIFGHLLRAVVNPMIFTALGLFHRSHKQGAYNSVDVKVTYALLSCTASLEYIGMLWTFARIIFSRNLEVAVVGLLAWPDQIAQYNFIAQMASKKKHWILTSIAAFMGCEDYLDPLWCLKPYKSSSAITELVRGYIETWKSEHRKEAAVDNRGHWTLKKQLGCDVNEMLRESIQKPFDESVLLWHLATEFCYSEGNSNTGSAATSNSRVISNYMVYLLFINPEMLMTGTRPSLFRDEYERLNGMLPDGEPTQELGEAELAKKIIQKLKGGAKDTCVADDASSLSGEEELCIAEDAWALSEELMKLCKDDDEKNMWAVIEGVWVEMLCFSASRCRGYLHAKSLGKGGEYLSYIWLLLWVTGIKTLSEKTQRTPELPKQQGDKPVTPVIGVKERDEDSGSHGATSSAAVTPVIGDEIV